MTKPLANVALARPTISESSIAEACKTLRSGWLGYGPRCLELEQKFSDKRGGWALATQSCTAALWAVAMVTRSGNQPEIIIPANTYVACAAAFQVAGWRIRLCDVDSGTGLLDLDDVHRHVTEHTRALLVVDTYGQRFPESAARHFCTENELWLIRDAAHRLDLDEEAPTLADFVCYSFGPTKEVASPDGGLIWSSATTFEEQARAFTFWGISHDTWHRVASPQHVSIAVSNTLGLKLRMTDVNAAIILTQLADWPEQRDKRRALLKTYRQAFAGKNVTVLDRKDDDSCLMAPVLVDSLQRSDIRAQLADIGIATSDHYPTLASLLADPSALYPNADAFCSSVIAMPMHLQVKEEDIVRAASVF